MHLTAVIFPILRPTLCYAAGSHKLIGQMDPHKYQLVIRSGGVFMLIWNLNW